MLAKVVNGKEFIVPFNKSVGQAWGMEPVESRCGHVLNDQLTYLGMELEDCANGRSSDIEDTILEPFAGN